MHPQVVLEEVVYVCTLKGRGVFNDMLQMTDEAEHNIDSSGSHRPRLCCHLPVSC